MKSITSANKTPTTPLTAVQRGQAACKIMAKELRAEHKRWKLPLLSWKNGKIVATDP